MSSRKKRSNPMQAVPVDVPRAKPLRPLPSPPPPPPPAPPPPEQRTPVVTINVQNNVRTPLLGEAVPLFDPTLRVPNDGAYVSMGELRDRVRASLNAPISDANGNRQMLEMFAERHGGSLEGARQQFLGDIDPMGYPEEAMTATQVADRQRRRDFDEIAAECNYIRGAGYGDGSPSRFRPMDYERDPLTRGQDFINTYEVELPGGQRFRLEPPIGTHGEAHFAAYAKHRAERELLPNAWARAHERYGRMGSCRFSFGVMFDGYITFFFLFMMDGRNAVGFAINTRNEHEWTEMPRGGNDGYDAVLDRLVWRVFCDALPQFRGMRRR